jgi:NitT/TauT family transport system substrate-binding protein
MRSEHTKRAMVVLLVSIVIISLGCLSSPDEKSAISTLRIGYQPTTHHLAEMAASEMGWWQRDLEPFGVKEIKEFAYPCGVAESKALKNGELDVAYIGTASLIGSISQGLEAKIVAAVNINGSNLVLRQGIEYNGPGSLNAKTIGCLPNGTIQNTILREWLKKNNVNISGVNLVFLGPDNVVMAMLSGSVDGVFVPQPGPAIIESIGLGRSVVASGEMWPNQACCGIAVSEELIRDHPDIVLQIVKTNINATDYINANPVEAAFVYSNYTGQDLNMTISSLNTWDGRWISDPHCLINDTLEYARLQYELNYTQKMLSLHDLFDTSFYDKTTVPEKTY